MCLSKFLILNAVLLQLLAFFHLFLHICNCRHLLSLFHLTYNSILSNNPSLAVTLPFIFLYFLCLTILHLSLFHSGIFLLSDLSEPCLLLSTSSLMWFPPTPPSPSVWCCRWSALSLFWWGLEVIFCSGWCCWGTPAVVPSRAPSCSSISAWQIWALCSPCPLHSWLPVSRTGSLEVEPVSSWDSQLQSQWEWRSSAWQHCMCWGIVSLHPGWDHLLVWQKCECEAEVGL